MLRQGRFAAAVLGLLMMVTSCASGGGHAPASTPGPSVDTTFGRVTVPARPQRVVALGWSDAETALALGVQPVGASDWQGSGGNGVGPWAAGLYTQPPTKLGTTEPDYEAIAALRPDLILNTRSSGDPAQNEILSKIAPTVGPPPGTVAYGTGWREQMRLVSQALGKPELGEQRIAELDGRLRDATRTHPEPAGKTVAVAAYYGNKWGAYLPGDPRVEFMTDLGMKNKPEINALANGTFYADIAHERLSTISADLTVVFPIGVDARQLRDDPVLNQIPSARAGHLLVLDDHDLTMAFSSGSTLGIGYAVEHAAPRFAAALRGS
ncbi:iron-siderophore ABC transporter substrate-binding protein [Saccharopolyspora erythraea]|uniref:iron-siderophore ABC transporter substrate-binding protein n=1 Tax=Saccharopolyspora erythraea TaxID=1836 RepID=UPI001BA4E036|nr:iron-siderophore ABC transporter substrate-binding protein [Saccharopolyspora erythraea]QUH03537.1 iron-siderophore ABC transporter substrate-binding protein [Saccharopolyspora erythraea]